MDRLKTRRSIVVIARREAFPHRGPWISIPVCALARNDNGWSRIVGGHQRLQMQFFYIFLQHFYPYYRYTGYGRVLPATQMQTRSQMDSRRNPAMPFHPRSSKPHYETFPSTTLLLKTISYRKPLQVRQVILFQDGCSYPLCPRCNSTIEREYMRYCDRCGQCLEWNAFSFAEVCTCKGR